MKKSAAFYGTGIVLAHLLVNIVHGAAHTHLHIELSPAGMAFVVVVILLCPLLAMFLLWTTRRRLGLLLLASSMAGALVFGLYHHFVMAGLDQLGQQGSGPWASAFAITAWLLAITEAGGAFFALYLLAPEGSVRGG